MSKPQVLGISIAALILMIICGCGAETDFTSDEDGGEEIIEARHDSSTGITITIEPDAKGKGPSAFGTNPLIISQGTQVIWINKDDTSHTATSTTGAFDSGILTPNKSFSYTFQIPGTYPYYCAIQGKESMSGVIQVGPPPSTSAETPAPQPSHREDPSPPIISGPAPSGPTPNTPIIRPVRKKPDISKAPHSGPLPADPTTHSPTCPGSQLPGGVCPTPAFPSGPGPGPIWPAPHLPVPVWPPDHMPPVATQPGPMQPAPMPPPSAPTSP